VLSSIRKCIDNWKARNRLLLTRVPSVLVTLLEHSIYFLGLASITYGAWLAWHPLGYVAGGGILVFVSFSVTAERALAERSRRNTLED
jgi:hypothetical protein